MTLAFADELQDANLWCATIARGTPGMIPMAQDDTATLTFVSFEGRTYGVTARHVIEIFIAAGKAAREPSMGYFLPAAPGVVIGGPFVYPLAPFMGSAPDIAIVPIHPDLPAYIGKKVFVLEPTSPTFPIPYAMAAGFPTSMKALVKEPHGNKIQMSGITAVAEGVGSSEHSDQVQFYSEVLRSEIDGDVSGMSGGPVFWSDGQAYGLLGFVKEALADELDGGDIGRVNFITQRVTYELFGQWADYADSECPVARDRQNAEIKRLQVLKEASTEA